MYRSQRPTDLFSGDELQINSHFFQVREKSCLVPRGAFSRTFRKKSLRLHLACLAELPASLQTRIFFQMIQTQMLPRGGSGFTPVHWPPWQSGTE